MASLGASGMMTASFCLFLIFLILPGQLVLGCPLDDLLNKKIEEQASSYVLATLQKLQLICSSVTSRGALATCPSGPWYQNFSFPPYPGLQSPSFRLSSS
ncbi:resistin isoform X2 [Antechinus flavipes]|uniref:resistin isoform X2 n=1 Tax=Antechinus flavipes TaxID=38775 RepID=UPI002235AF3F|nr:resistin isoform X2 [Antechinus flavipes]